MSYKYDFPHPPHHYKSMTSENSKIAPNLDQFFAKVKMIHIFGQPESVQDASVRFVPNYLANIKNVVIPNKGFRTDLLFLVDRLTTEFTDYINGMHGDPYSLLQRSSRITELITQIFYVLKVAKNTNESAMQLNEILKAEIEENKRLIEEYTILVKDIKIKLDALLN